MVSSWWGTGSKEAPKKEPAFPAALKLITGRRQTEWTGASRCPNEDDWSHKRESLTVRKRTIFFKLCLPCRPLAELRDTSSIAADGRVLSTSRPREREDPY